MLENEWTALRRVTSAARVEFRGERRAASDDRAALVRVVAIAATDLAFQNRVMVRQIEFTPLVQMALKTRLGRFSGIDDRMVSSSGFVMQAARSMAGFAPYVRRILSGSF